MKLWLNLNFQRAEPIGLQIVAGACEVWAAENPFYDQLTAIVQSGLAAQPKDEERKFNLSTTNLNAQQLALAIFKLQSLAGVLAKMNLETVAAFCNDLAAVLQAAQLERLKLPGRLTPENN